MMKLLKVVCFPSGAAVKQRADRCSFQVPEHRHHIWPLFLLQSRGRCRPPWGLPDCGSNLPESHLGNFF